MRRQTRSHGSIDYSFWIEERFRPASIRKVKHVLRGEKLANYKEMTCSIAMNKLRAAIVNLILL